MSEHLSIGNECVVLDNGALCVCTRRLALYGLESYYYLIALSCLKV